MFSISFKAALAASCLLVQLVSATPAPSPTVASQTGTPTYAGPRNALSTIGCFSTPEPMSDQGSYIFQSDGNCQAVCLGLGNTVMGLVNGTSCWCGNLLPPLNSVADNSSCSTPCSGTDIRLCGGDNYWLVVLTGLTKNKIANLDPASVTGTNGSPTTKTSTSSLGASTVVVTATHAPGATNSPSPSKPNTVGIAVGVVVGVVAIAGLIIGVLFFLRQRRRREVEDEYKRQASVNQFVSGGHKSNSSMNDSRLDPELVRRDSTGSIADNQDYSRRILKVCSTVCFDRIINANIRRCEIPMIFNNVGCSIYEHLWKALMFSERSRPTILYHQSLSDYTLPRTKSLAHSCMIQLQQPCRVFGLTTTTLRSF
jgi:cell wall integrity and stress response component